MSPLNKTVPMTSTLPWKLYLLTSQVSRYCPLALQRCTVAAVPVMRHYIRRCLSCVTVLFVEKDNIHASHLDGSGCCDIKKLRSYYTEGQAFFRSYEASNLNSYSTWRRITHGEIRYWIKRTAGLQSGNIHWPVNFFLNVPFVKSPYWEDIHAITFIWHFY